MLSLLLSSSAISGGFGLRCPFCGQDDDRVIDSRPAEDGNAIRRRRECQACGRRYTTYERVERFPVRVVKKDGRRENYSRDKLLTGILKACHKLPIESERIETALSRIERKIFDYESDEVPTHLIGEWVMQELRKLHKVAYIRFASVYREFRGVDDFVRAVQETEGK